MFRKKLLCPVCKSHLGDRYDYELFIGHCEECRATFLWKAHAKSPEAHLDKDNKNKRCGCGSCGR